MGPNIEWNPAEISSLSSLTMMGSKDENSDKYGYLKTFMVQSETLYDAIAISSDRLKNGEFELSQATAPCGEDGECAKAEFLNLFEGELNRVTHMISSQQESQELSAKALLKNINSMVKNYGSDSVSSSFRTRADDLAEMCMDLQRFVAKNVEIFTAVATRADSEIDTQCLSFLKRRLAVAPWKEGSNSALVVVLSDIYEDVRKANNTDADTKSSSEASYSKWTSFSLETSTAKYWVKESDLTKLLLTAAGQAPLTVHGKQGGHLNAKSDLTTFEGDKLWESLAVKVNSIYFDSPTRSITTQNKLFRVRWYGKKPKGDEPVFLELKTQQDKWTNDNNSTKERVSIREKDMSKFLSSDDWSLEVARQLVFDASPSLSDEKLEKQAELLDTMHNLVITENLRPRVRSRYSQVAFQTSDSNALRLVLVRNATLIDETRAPHGSWCLPDKSMITSDMVSKLPHPVFEIKLSDAALPSAFQDLIDDGILVKVPEFFRFLN